MSSSSRSSSASNSTSLRLPSNVEIDAHLEGAPFKINDDQTRTLLKRGSLQKLEPKTNLWQSRVFLLFNDLLLWCKAKNKTTLEYRGHMNLNGVCARAACVRCCGAPLRCGCALSHLARPSVCLQVRS